MRKFIYAEEKIAEQIGYNRALIIEKRNGCCERGVDFKEENNRTVWTARAVKRVLKALGIVLPHKNAPALNVLIVESLLLRSIAPEVPEEDVPVDGPARATLVVERIPVRRSRMLLATFADPARLKDFDTIDGKCVTVRVRDNKNFIVGTEIPCVYAGGSAWEFVGRCPRTRREGGLIGRRT